MTTLCIVDMQTSFETAKMCLTEVCYQIRLAKRRNAGIVILEYGDEPDYQYGKTHSRIKKLLCSYNRKIYVKKSGDGGGAEFIAAAAKKNFDISKVRFVGVNRCACVKLTIREFKRAKRKAKVEIAIAATWCEPPIEDGERILRRLGTFVGRR